LTASSGRTRLPVVSTSGSELLGRARERAVPRADRAPRRVGRWRVSALLRLISPVGLVLLWQLLSSVGVISEDKLSSPLTIGRTAAQLISSGELGDALLVSVRRVALGFAIGLVVGAVIGIAAGLSRWSDLLIDPPMQMLRTLPFLGLIPLFIIWFGIGEAPKVALVALGTAFPLYVNVHAGIRDADQRLVEATTVLGFSRWERIRHVVLPSAVPNSLVGLRLGLAAAWLSLVVGEQINASAGLGYMINNASEFGRNDIVLVALLVYAILGLLTDGIVRLLERRLLRWRTS
jgi:sulfonate transport system permease protein